jgi:hypothetical protein
MAQVDPNIAMGFRPVQIPLEESPLNRLRERAEFENSLLKSQEMQRGIQERNALSRINATSGLEMGSPEYLSRVQQEAPGLYGEVATGLAQRENVLAQRDTRLAEAAKRKREQERETFETQVGEIIGYNNVKDVETDIATKEKAGAITPQQAAALRSTLPTDDNKLDSWRITTLRGLMPPKERLADIRAEGKETRDADRAKSELQKNYDAAKASGFTGTFVDFVDQSRESETEREYRRAKAAGYTGSFLDFKKQVAVANKVVVNAPAPVTPVTVVDPKDPTKTVVLDARTGRAIGQGVKEPVGVQLSAKEKQAREAKYPQATSAIKTFETKSESLAKDLEKLADHPGLSGISGVLYGRTPGVTRDARAALELYNSIIARGGFAELQAMRASSPTGGALGNVSNQEGQYLRDAFAAIGRVQDKKDLAQALKDAAESVRGAKQRTREAYDMTYEYKTGGATNAPDPLGIR